MSIDVYVAARWETRVGAADLRDALAERGIGCTSRWLEEEPSLGSVPMRDDAFKRKMAQMDVLGVQRAQALVLWNPAEKGKVGTGGCHVETGIALACGKPVLVVGPASNLFHWMPGVRVILTDSALSDPPSALGWVDVLVAEIRDRCVDFEHVAGKAAPARERPCPHNATFLVQDAGSNVRRCWNCGEVVGGVAP